MVLLINGSPRKQGNTRRALEIVARALEEEGVDTNIVQLAARTCAAVKAAVAVRG